MENTEVVVKKGRGRPAGSIRAAYFVVTAIDSNNKLCQEQIQTTRINDGKKVSKDDMRNEVREIFIAKYHMDPLTVRGPYFEANLDQGPETKRETVQLTEEEVDYTNRKFHAEYNGWQVVGRYLNDKQGNEIENIAKISFKRRLDSDDKKKQPPRDAFKMISDLENIVDV